MNYIVVFKKRGALSSLFFVYRDESNVAYSADSLIRNEDDVIKAMEDYFETDDNIYVIRETYLDVDTFREDNYFIMHDLERFLK